MPLIKHEDHLCLAMQSGTYGDGRVFGFRLCSLADYREGKVDLAAVWRTLDEELMRAAFRATHGRELQIIPGGDYEGTPEEASVKTVLSNTLRDSSVFWQRAKHSTAINWLSGVQSTDLSPDYSGGRKVGAGRLWEKSDIVPREVNGKKTVSAIELYSYEGAGSALAFLIHSHGPIMVEYPYDVKASLATLVRFGGGQCPFLLGDSRDGVCTSFGYGEGTPKGMKVSPKKRGARLVEFRFKGEIEHQVIAKYEPKLPFILTAQLVAKGHGLATPGARARVEVDAYVCVGTGDNYKQRLYLDDGQLWVETSGSKKKADFKLAPYSAVNGEEVVRALSG